MNNEENKPKISEEQIKANAISEITSGTSTETAYGAIDPTGWIEIKRSELSYEGKLYPSNYRFMLKPVNAGLLKYFATIDEKNPMSVQDALIYVIKNHVKILMDGKYFVDSYENIYEHDRLYFTLLVHEYSGSPTNLVIKGKTPKGKDQDVIVKPSSLIFSEVSDKGMGYLNPQTGEFNIRTETFGVLKYKPLTLSQSMTLTQFVYNKTQEGIDTPEPFFMQAAPFFITDANKDKPEEIYKDYFAKSQDMKYVSVLLQCLKAINIELLLEFNAIDEETKLPFRTPVTSLRGIKDIFTFSDSTSELQ